MQFVLSPSSYAGFSKFLHEKLGIVLGDNKQYLVRSRLSAIAHNNNYTCINTFLADVIKGDNAVLTEQSLELMTTNETFWFRDIYPFIMLKHHLLPALNKQHRKVRIWSSACASGQEPYSIAMTISEYKRENPSAFPGGIEIVGSDISGKMISAAKLGIYNEIALNRGLSEQHKELYFEHTPFTLDSKGKQLIADIKRMVQFKQFNLLNDFDSMGKFDIIFCRNVLIYFDGKQKTQILKKLAASLSQSGALMLGAAESINGAEGIFQMRTIDKGLYYSKL